VRLLDVVRRGPTFDTSFTSISYLSSLNYFFLTRSPLNFCVIQAAFRKGLGFLPPIGFVSLPLFGGVPRRASVDRFFKADDVSGRWSSPQCAPEI
jgi:hypothetical protein